MKRRDFDWFHFLSKKNESKSLTEEVQQQLGVGMVCMRSSRNWWTARPATPYTSSLAKTPPPMHCFQLSFI